jgi:Tol biopolymer transport system component
MQLAPLTTRAQVVTNPHQSSGSAVSGAVALGASIVTKPRQSSGYAMRGLRLLAVLLLALAGAVTALANSPVSDGDWAIFISQRDGAAELYLINLNTRQVSQLTNSGRGHLTPATSANARRVAYASRQGSSYELFVAEISSAWRTRRPLLAALNRLTINTIDETTPTLTRDGGVMAFASGDGIELMSTEGQGRRVLVPSSPTRIEFAPAISPDGRFVAFISNRSGASEIWLASTADGSLRQLTSGGAVIGGLSWTADAQQIAFTTTATASKLSGIAIANATSGTFRVLTQEGDGEPAISPNGTRVLFTSLRDGDPELYLLNLSTGAVERLTNNLGADGSAAFISAPVSPVRIMPPSRTAPLVERTRW